VRVVLQRVSRARVWVVSDHTAENRSGDLKIAGHLTAEIGSGVVILLGIGPSDHEESAAYLTEKIANLRIFEDKQGKINRSLLEVGGAAIVVSQLRFMPTREKGGALLSRTPPLQIMPAHWLSVLPPCSAHKAFPLKRGNLALICSSRSTTTAQLPFGWSDKSNFPHTFT